MARNTGRSPSNDSSVPSITDELVVRRVEGIGNVLTMVPAIPDSAPHLVREGLARRRLVAITGQCPCGATLDLQGVALGMVTEIKVEHEDQCPAVTGNLENAIRRWRR